MATTAVDLSALHLDDLTAGTGRWRNIQDSVRQALHTLCLVVTEQDTRIKSLEAQLQAVAGHVDAHQAALGRHARRMDGIDDHVAKAATGTAQRAEHADAVLLERVQRVEAHAQRNTALVQSLEAQVPAVDDLQAFALKSEVAEKASIVDVNEALAVKANKETVDRALRRKANREEVLTKEDAVSQRDWERVTTSIDSVERRLADAVKEVGTAVSRKASKADVQHAARELDRQLRATIDEVVAAVGKKASKAELSKALDGKADLRHMGAESASLRAVSATQEEVLRMMKAKADGRDVGALRASVDRMKRRVKDLGVAVESKASRVEVQHSLQAAVAPPPPSAATADAVDKPRPPSPHAFAAAPPPEVTARLHTVATKTEELANGLAAMRRRLDVVATAAAASAGAGPAAGAGAGVSSSTPAYMSSPARLMLMWQQSAKGLGGAVAWTVAATHSAPDLIQWTKGGSQIVCVRPGLYKIAACFFSPAPATITVLVEDTAVVASRGSGSYKEVSYSHPSGRVVGTSLVEFLALPARARVAVVYECDAGFGKGFVDLQKL